MCAACHRPLPCVCALFWCCGYTVFDVVWPGWTAWLQACADAGSPLEHRRPPLQIVLCALLCACLPAPAARLLSPLPCAETAPWQGLSCGRPRADAVHLCRCVHAVGKDVCHIVRALQFFPFLTAGHFREAPVRRGRSRLLPKQGGSNTACMPLVQVCCRSLVPVSDQMVQGAPVRKGQHPSSHVHTHA